MSSGATVDLQQMETNSSSASLVGRSKKVPPPPLCLPAINITTDEEKRIISNQQREQKKASNNCCLSSMSEDCSHNSISYTLPTSQRPQILETLMASSSVLLIPPFSDTKHKKSSISSYANQINLFKQRQPSSKMTVTDAEWIDFMSLIIHKPLENELKLLLDKYKMTYFDQVNAPNTTDDTIRSSLCAIVSEALSTYSNNSIFSPLTTDDLTNNGSPATTVTVNSTSKRKRKDTSNSFPLSAPITVNTQTKFVISHIIPGIDNNGNKTSNQQKQFQNKYNHLFKYIPDKDEQAYLIREGYMKNISNPSRSSTVCLMLYDEVLSQIDDYDLELSEISINHSFTLPESILAHISFSIQ